MSDKLGQIYNSCDPFLPAPEDFYYDCRDARGGDAFLKNVFNHLLRSNAAQDGEEIKSKFRHFLFSGHLGSGKSSELKHLVRKLKEENRHNVTFFPIYIDTFDYLDTYDVSVTDILLSIVAELGDTLRNELNIDLKDSYFRNKFEEIKSVALSEVEINEAELDIGYGKLKIQRLKQNPSARKIVRDALKPGIPTILAEVNNLFLEARLKVRKKTVGESSLKYSDIVIIIDNLEKMEKFENFEEGLESYKKLFIDFYPQLTGLQSHVIFTVPLRLVRSDVAPILREYYSEPFVLPMVKIAQRKTHESFDKGVDAMKKILQKRLGDLNLDDAFEKAALKFLIQYSGGSIRYLMSFVRESTTYNDTLPITMSNAWNAVKQTVQTFATAIPESHWELLAKLDLSEDQRIPNDNDDYRKMLENLSVLEYINGGDEDVIGDFTQASEQVAPWYAVNPIVRELSQFKRARERIAKSRKSPAKKASRTKP